MPIGILLVPLLLLLGMFILGAVIWIAFLFGSAVVGVARPHHWHAHR